MLDIICDGITLLLTAVLSLFDVSQLKLGQATSLLSFARVVDMIFLLVACRPGLGLQ